MDGSNDTLEYVDNSIDQETLDIGIGWWLDGTIDNPEFP